MSDERIYPCDRCGVMRSKAEGGTVFTVCDECWDALKSPPMTSTPNPLAARVIREFVGENERLREAWMRGEEEQ